MFCPQYYIFLKYILVFFFFTHFLPKPAQQTNNTEIEKKSQQDTQACFGTRRLVLFLLLDCRWLLQACNSVQCVQKICWVYLTRPCLSASFCTGFRTANNYLGAVSEIFRFVFAAARSSWNIFVPLPTALDFRRSASGFWSGTGFIAQGSIFFFLHRVFIFNSRLVCVCPACFHFPWQKMFLAHNQTWSVQQSHK